ncbi:MAG: hypothetical protein M3N53_12995 [Actinomycetota bacterium]|nr:hypothetical protein [Actinomycetota bacterium]
MGPIDESRDLLAWTTQVISRARAHGPIEDASLELKATWPEPKRAARQLAGQANASSEKLVRWLIGVGEDGEVRGAPRIELSTWWAQVRAHFDGQAPTLSERVVQSPGTLPVMVLEFKVGNKPYIFKPQTRGTDREVPWREGTGTRSATKQELASLFVQRIELPKAFLLNAVLTATKSQHEVHWILPRGSLRRGRPFNRVGDS